jgi:GntR family transcriptional regulator, transcriptional repressor for pyruvate dehydrogenase complex
VKFKHLVSDKLSEKAIVQIKSLIDQGKLKPGQRLPSERELSLQLGISRGILREALKTLESLGYLSRKPGGGTYIRDLINHNYDLSLSDTLIRISYLDYLEVREMLEQKVIQLAIERASQEEIEELENIVKLIENADATSELVLQFHYKLALITKNIILSNFMKANYRLHKDFVLTSSVKENVQRRKRIFREHQAILEAIKERDYEKARQAVTAHLNQVRHFLRKTRKSIVSGSR